MTGRFLSTAPGAGLCLDYIDGRTWRLRNAEAGFGFALEGAGDRRLIIPADGYETDLASIPRPLWAVLPPAGRGSRSGYAPAAVIHDWLYYARWAPADTAPALVPRANGRKEADDVFLAAMEALGVRPATRRAMYLAVRVFGGSRWNRKTEMT